MAVALFLPSSLLSLSVPLTDEGQDEHQILELVTREGGSYQGGVKPDRFCQRDYRPQKRLPAFGTFTLTISLTNLKNAYLHQNTYRPHKRLPAFANLTSTKTLTNLKNAYLLTKFPVATDHSNAEMSNEIFI